MCSLLTLWHSHYGTSQCVPVKALCSRAVTGSTMCRTSPATMSGAQAACPALTQLSQQLQTLSSRCNRGKADEAPVLHPHNCHNTHTLHIPHLPSNTSPFILTVADTLVKVSSCSKAHMPRPSSYLTCECECECDECGWGEDVRM